MCLKTLYEVFASDVDNSSLFFVLAALAYHKNSETGDCFPSISTLIRTSRMSENTVVKSLKRLKALGYISWTQEPGKKRFYKIHLDSLPKFTPPEKLTPLKSEPSPKLVGDPPQNCGYTLPKTGGTPSPNLPPESGSNQEINQEGNQESSLSRLGEFPNADEHAETLPYDEAPLFDDYPELEKSQKPKRAKSTSIQKPAEVSEDIWKEWKEDRRKKQSPVSQRVLDRLSREATKANMTLEQVMICQMEHGWKGFEASWLDNEKNKGKLVKDKFVKPYDPNALTQDTGGW